MVKIDEVARSLETAWAYAQPGRQTAELLA
jgi:hypothetical protein